MMDRREFLASIPGAMTQTCRRAVPEIRRLEWLRRVLGMTRRETAQMVALDAADCPACHESECDCVTLTTD